MTIKKILIVIIGIIFLQNCTKSKNQQFVHVELSLFEVKGNGSKLNFPVFSQTISIDEILRDVNISEYYHKKLSTLYDFKDFTYKTSGVWEGLIFNENSHNINAGSPIFMDYFTKEYQNKYEMEVVLSSFNDDKGEFVLRIAKPDGRKKDIKHHKITIQSGQSASIGALYDESKNKGFLYVISLISKEITPDTTPEEFAQFLKTKNSLGGILPESSYTQSDQSWMDQIFGDGTYKLPIKPPPPMPQVKFVPYDTPPKPIGGFAAIKDNLIYPETAKKESLEGTVVLQVLINENGKTSEVIVAKGIREDMDQAAIQAIKAVEWKPALQSDKPVAVWISIPIVFRLD